MNHRIANSVTSEDTGLAKVSNPASVTGEWACLGPIRLSPGISVGNAITKLYASFATIAALTGMSLLQGYILTEHLNVPKRAQGTVSGDLAFWTEVITLICFIPFGTLADRFGRRPIFVSGILMVGLSWTVYPFASTVDDLFLIRIIYGIGVAATAGTLATLVNDYPQENSRGKFIALAAMCNVVGTIFVARVIGGIPAWLGKHGIDAVTGGRIMYLTVAMMCVVTAVAARIGLKAGTPVDSARRLPVGALLTSGLKRMGNPRIFLAYAGSFAARSDVVVKGLFLALWAIQAGRQSGLTSGEAMARFGTVITIMYLVSLASAPLFGWFIDRVNRVTATIVALTFGTAGYLSMYIISSPIDFSMLPYMIVLTLGAGFMTKATMALIGQEAPVKERGSVIAMAQMFGAIGILVFTVVGGRLFDAWGPWAPFVIAGAYQGVLIFAGAVIRIFAPGLDIRSHRG